MTKIKYINCFGTSNTAGGGFEFDSPTQGWFINSLYGHIPNEEKTIFNFSYGYIIIIKFIHKILLVLDILS
jgi:hypothetical protein